MREVTNIPDNQVDQVVKDFEDDGCHEIEKIKQPNGNWTVRANCR